MDYLAVRIANFILTLQYYLTADHIPIEDWLNTESSENFFSLFCPEAYQNIIIYNRYLRGSVNNLSDDSIGAGEKSIGIYQARYVIEKLPKEKIKKALYGVPPLANEAGGVTDDWLKEVDKKGAVIYQKISKLLDEDDFIDKFTKLDTVRVTAPMLDDYDALFRYPAFLEFTPKAHEIIHKRIKNDEINSRIIDYYFSFADTYEETVALFPLLEEVITNTTDDHLLWTAGDALNVIWKLVPSSDEYLNARFEKQIYNMYWPRINSLWPIVNYPKFEFKEERDSKIFDDALGWVTSLNTLTKINPDFGNYFDFLAGFSEEDQLKNGIPKPIRFCVFKRKYQDKSPRRFIHLAFDVLPAEEALELLAHPETKDEAKIAMDIILSGDIDADNLPYLSEQLLLTGNPEGIGSYIINRFARNLEKYESFVARAYPDELKTHNVAMTVFTAACESVSAEDEIPALEKFAKAIKALPSGKESSKQNTNTIDACLQKAKSTISDILKARQKLIEYIAY